MLACRIYQHYLLRNSCSRHMVSVPNVSESVCVWEHVSLTALFSYDFRSIIALFESQYDIFVIQCHLTFINLIHSAY
jgi:hypothetical protein